ncbi:MAG TPA: acyl carrier protein [Candidatus Dormibacteraeota bacterium]|nr:acyl carrier protein [Candidatus Dormibacteraeota bacterium]
MNEFLKKLAEVLEVPELKESDELKAFPQWDSLAVLSVIAMLDSNYGVNLRAADLGAVTSAADLWNLVQSKKK